MERTWLRNFALLAMRPSFPTNDERLRRTGPPETDNFTTRKWRHSTDASTTNSSMTVVSWTFPVEASFASSKTSHIWAMSTISPNSADASATIVKHNREGVMNMDLTKPPKTNAAASGSGCSALTSDSTSKTGGPSSSSNSEGARRSFRI
ncbi:unnamed protein product [Tilletia laevis]|nr:hypothetical protein CF336_g5046 [Tilletia laevis]KAE8258715.1 hypothetical protein A4X03_0g4298 [Tilletia caries]KAE8198126.1 hypothetical protein CF335_g4458 [Tilletia laevis]CAD6938546.1 unnamed protein product [Tilletia laevis]CAD6947932.1 unnamed protein product [Tilletia caries]